MARAQYDSGSLRLGRRESARVIAALVLSLLAHLAIWGGYHVGHKLGWWEKIHPPKWLQPLAKIHPLPPPRPNTEEPTTFVDVSHADADAPEKPKYYSYRNSHAANPVEANQNAPQINGKQTVVVKTEDAARAVKKDTDTEKTDTSSQSSKAHPLTPSPNPASVEAPQTPGETELLKTNTTAVNATQPQPPQVERPRTLKEALAQRKQLPGQMMQQVGGVSRHAQFTALDAKATSFGEYDRAMIEAVTQHWYDLLDRNRYADDRNGKVTVQFKLMSDGTVIEVQVVENTVGINLSLLCVDAIEEAAGFGKWPSDMMREIGKNYREVTFTFYYY
jgi:outer membrane biosynthesis protein TonB